MHQARMTIGRTLIRVPNAVTLAVLLAATTAQALPPDSPPDYETITTGLSLGILFEPQFASGPSTALNTHYLSQYGDLIEAAGFRSVRLRVNMDQFTANTTGTFPNYQLTAAFMNNLEYAVTNLLSRRTNTFYVLISPTGLEDNTVNSELQMSNYWGQIAAKFSNTTHRLIFNLMNEPNINATEFTNSARIESMYRATTSAIRPSNPTRYLVYYYVHNEYHNGTSTIKNTPYSDVGPGETDFMHGAIPTNAGPYRIYDFHVLGDESPNGEDKRTARVRQAWEFRQYYKFPVWSGAWNYGAWNTSWDTGAVARVVQNLKDHNIPGTYLMFNSSQTSIYDPVDSDRNGNGITNEWTQPAYPPIITARNPIVWNSRAPYWTNSFHPVCDSYVKANSPADTGAGETATLLVKQLGGGFERTSYLKFNLARQLPGAITSAILNIRCRSQAPTNTIQVRLAANSNWDERSLAFSNAPALGSTVFDSRVVGVTNAWYQFNITAAITNNGIYTLALTTAGTDITEFFSRDQGDPDWLSSPDLVVITAKDYAWNNNGSGNWDDAAKWTPAASPRVVASRVFITNNITADRTITVNITNATIGQLMLGDIANASNDFTIATNGTGLLTFDNGGSTALLSNAAANAQNFINGAVVLADNLSIDCAAPLSINAGISGAGKHVSKTGSSLLTLGGTNVYSGDTIINSGTALVNCSIAGSVIVSNSAVIGGVGTIGGVLVLNYGASLTPGTNSIGTLSVASAPVLAGKMILELNRSASPNADNLRCTGGSLAFGGTLIVTNIGPAPISGDIFDLFDANTITGSFASITLPAGGTAHWITNLLTVNGTLVFTNSNPNAPGLAISVISGVASNFIVIGGPTPPTDANAGDVLMITAVSMPAHGVTTTDGTNITYTANYDYSGSDNFTYTVSDNFGGSAVGGVSVSATPPAGYNQIGVALLGEGFFKLSYLGIPATNYALDWRTNLLLGGWIPLATNPANNAGHVFFTNNLNWAESYFRMRSVP